MPDLFLGPDEGLCFVVICVDVGIDVLLELFEACEGGATERLPLQDREPYFDLIEPGRACRREPRKTPKWSFDLWWEWTEEPLARKSTRPCVAPSTLYAERLATQSQLC